MSAPGQVNTHQESRPNAQVDLDVVMSGQGDLIEVSGGKEGD